MVARIFLSLKIYPDSRFQIPLRFTVQPWLQVASRDISGDKDLLSGANGRTDDVAMTNVNKTYASVLKSSAEVE